MSEPPRHLLVAGAQRCGTTFVHDLLASHPQVAMARPARPEPKVFCSEELTARGLEWYVATYFSHAEPGQLRGEKSTSYLETAEAAERAERMLGAPLVLVSLRDPIERAVSNWAFSTDNGFEDRPLEDALRGNLDAQSAGGRAWDAGTTSVSPYAYLERGRYVDYLRPWLDRFGELVTVVFLAELRRDREAVASMYRSLGVDPAFAPPQSGPVNSSDAPAPALDEGLRARLADYYADSDRELSALLGRDLPWSSDGEGSVPPVERGGADER